MIFISYFLAWPVIFNLILCILKAELFICLTFPIICICLANCNGFWPVEILVTHFIFLMMPLCPGQHWLWFRLFNVTSIFTGYFILKLQFHGFSRIHFKSNPHLDFGNVAFPDVFYNRIQAKQLNMKFVFNLCLMFCNDTNSRGSWEKFSSPGQLPKWEPEAVSVLRPQCVPLHCVRCWWQR